MARKKKTVLQATELIQVPDDRLERFRRWRFKVSRAQELRKKWEKEYEVERCERYLLGKQRPTDDDQSLVLNWTLATVKTSLPNLYFQDPKFFVRPKPGHDSPEADTDARIGEGVLEAIAAMDNNLDNAARLALYQSFLRIGVMKIIYDPEMEKNPKGGDLVFMTDQAGNPVIDKTKLKPLTDPSTGQSVVDPQTGQPTPDPSSVTFLPLLDQQGQQLTEPDEVATRETYRYEWVNAKNMLLPDEGPDRNKWTWIGEEIVVPLEEAKEDTRFPKKLRDRLKSNETISGAGSSRFALGAEREKERFRYFELWDIDDEKVRVVADGQDFQDFLLEDDFPDGVIEHPYALLLGYTAIQAPDPLPWPLPHVYSWLDPQREYNIRRTQIMEGAKRSARKFVYEDGTFDDVDEAVKILQSPKDMEGARVTDVNKRPVMVEAPDLNPSIYRDIPLLQIDWRTITGQTAARLGNPEGGVDTATEASFIQQAASIRDVDMRSQVETWLGEAGRKMLDRVKATLTIDMWIKLRGFSDDEFQKYVTQVYGISGQELQYLPSLKESFRERFGKIQWKRLTKDDLDFEADVSVAPGSSRPPNLESERKQKLAFMQVIGQFPQIALSRELLHWLAESFEGIPDRMIDEINALAMKMVQVNANQAGRNQGGAAAPPDAGNGAMPDLAGLAGMLSGAAVRPS